LDYAHTIRTYANEFGRRAVHVAVFEDLREDSKRFITTLCQFLDIDGEEGLRLTERKTANIRLSAENMGALRSIAKSWLRTIRFRYAKPSERMSMIGMTKANISESLEETSEHIDANLIEAINSITREGNRSLVEEWGLPLEKYNYPL
jgi:hypothetical protein